MVLSIEVCEFSRTTDTSIDLGLQDYSRELTFDEMNSEREDPAVRQVDSD